MSTDPDAIHQLEQRLESLEARVGKLEPRVDKLEAVDLQLLGRMTAVEGAVARVEAAQTAQGHQLDIIEADVKDGLDVTNAIAENILGEIPPKRVRGG